MSEYQPSPLWSSRHLVIEVQKAGARFSTTLAQPFARIGSHPRSDVVLPGENVPRRCLYFHATDAGLFCVDLTASGPAAQAPPAHGWVQPDQRIRVGPYDITVETEPPAPTPPLGADGLDSRSLDEADAPMLTAVVGGEPLGYRLLHRRLTIIGRHRPSTIRLTSHHISACHCLLWWDAGRLWVVDLLSGNGTRLNGEHVEAALVNPGDTLKLGPVALTYEPPAVQAPAMSVVFPASTTDPGETTPSGTEAELARLQLEATRREMDRRQAEMESRQRELEARLREIESRSAAIEETRLAAERKLLEQTETLHRLLEEVAARRQELAAAEKRLEAAPRPDEPATTLPAVTVRGDASRGDVSAQGKNVAGLGETGPELLHPIRQFPRFWQEDPGSRRTKLVRPQSSREDRLMTRPSPGDATLPPGAASRRPHTVQRSVTTILAGLVGAAAAAAVVWFAVPWPSAAAMTMQFPGAAENVQRAVGTPATARGAADDLVLRPAVLAAMLQDPSLESVRRNTPSADLIDWLRGHVDVVPLATPGQVRIVCSSATAADALSVLTALAQAIRQATATERQDRRRELNSQYAAAEREHREGLDRIKELAASLNTGDPDLLISQAAALLAEIPKSRSELLPLEAEIKVLEARSARSAKTPAEHASPSAASLPVVAEGNSPEARVAELTVRRDEIAQSFAEIRAEAERLKQAAAELAALRDESELLRSRMVELDRLRTQLDLESDAGSVAVVEYPLIVRDGAGQQRSAALLAALAGFFLAGLLAFRRQPAFRGPLLPAELLAQADHTENADAIRSSTAAAPSPTTGTTTTV